MMPPLVRFLLDQILLGALLALLFLAALGWLGPPGLLRTLLAGPHPFTLAVAVLAGGLAPLATAFAATALWFHAEED